MHRLLLLVLSIACSRPLAAQWRVAVLVGSAASHGDARNDSDPTHPEFHANRPGTATVALARDWGTWRVTLEARRTTADLAEVGTGAVVVSTRGAFEGWGAALEFGARLAGNASSSWHAAAGIAADHWSFQLGSARWRPSIRGALEGDFGIARGWTAIVRGEATIGPSIFTPSELPEGFERHRMWRTGFSMGVARSWR